MSHLSDCLETSLLLSGSCSLTFSFSLLPLVMNGHTTCVRLLLDESDSADLVDAADSQGQWVLLCCSVCSLLLQFLQRVPSLCLVLIFRTPHMLAVAGGHVDAVSLLLEREANVNVANNHGLTALHLGVRSHCRLFYFLAFVEVEVCHPISSVILRNRCGKSNFEICIKIP